MDSCWSYDILKQMAIEGTSRETVEELKEFFSVEIGSPRKKSRIKTIEDLIDCLERSDQVNEENVRPLQIIGNQNRALQDALQQYRKFDHSRPVTNSYQEQRLADELQQQLHITQPRLRQPEIQRQNYVTSAAFTAEKKAAIYKKLSQELGRSWRDLARSLDITEGTIEDIECRFPDLKSRILLLLKTFEEDECNDPRQLLLLLCRGLSECGRKDLRRKVEQIMSY